MERSENGLSVDNSHPIGNFANGGKGVQLSSKFFLDYAGQVDLTLDADGLSWKFVESSHDEEDKHSCLGSGFVSKNETEVNFSDIYAVNFLDLGMVHESTASIGRRCFSGHSLEMYRIAVHFVNKSKTQSSIWTPSVYAFGHKNLDICKTWVNQINACIEEESRRPKSLMVFVHPRSGKGLGCRIWEGVAPLFSQAKGKTKVIVTESAGHARDVLSSITDNEISLYDGVVAVGGDGFFNEILNGLLLSRHNAPYPPAPRDFIDPDASECNVSINNDGRTVVEPCDCNEDQSPLLTGSEHISTLPLSCEQEPVFSFPNDTFRFGIIPAGSTDAIVICTTGARDPVTSALHIVLGKRVHLDIAQVVRWKTTEASNVEPYLRYAASFAGYGFYGDVITESEKYRWMGPKRYDFAGTKVFLQHRSYEAEVNYLEVQPEKGNLISETAAQDDWTLCCLPRKKDQVICRANCVVCNEKASDTVHGVLRLSSNFEDLKWLKTKGRFLSVGAAIMSNRNEKAPDGLVADAHLSDGFLHLILIKHCSHPSYLWHLIQLARRGGNPLDFTFVEHHKTPAFTFKSSGKEGMWNVDGELVQAHQLSAQVFRGLVSLFAAGPHA